MGFFNVTKWKKY